MPFLYKTPTGGKIDEAIKYAKIHNDFSGAQDLIEKVRNHYGRIFGYSQLAEFQAKSGDRIGAQETLQIGIDMADDITERGVSTWATRWRLYTELGCCGYLCDDQKTYNECIEKAKLIELDRARRNKIVSHSCVFASIAVAQARAGDILGSMETIEQIASDDVKVINYQITAMCKIALSIYSSNMNTAIGLLQRARTFTNQVNNTNEAKDRALIQISVSYKKIGDSLSAEECLQNLSSTNRDDITSMEYMEYLE